MEMQNPEKDLKMFAEKPWLRISNFKCVDGIGISAAFEIGKPGLEEKTLERRMDYLVQSNSINQPRFNQPGFEIGSFSLGLDLIMFG